MPTLCAPTLSTRRALINSYVTVNAQTPLPAPQGRGPLGLGCTLTLPQIPSTQFKFGVTPLDSAAVSREVGMPKVTQAKMCEMCGKRYTKEVLGPDDIHDLRTGDHRGTCGKCWRREFAKMWGVKSA